MRLATSRKSSRPRGCLRLCRMYLINAGVFVFINAHHTPHHTILESILHHKDTFEYNSGGGEGFLQSFINKFRSR